MINKLTPEEIVFAFSKYPLCKTEIFDAKPGDLSVPDHLQGLNYINFKVNCEFTSFEPHEVKLVLTQLKHITDNDIYCACYACDNVPFIGTVPDEWQIKRENDVIKVGHKAKMHRYQVDNHNGNVNVFVNERHSTLGCQANAIQYFYQNNYALPLYFGARHWANGKTLLDLGNAVPNRKPLFEMLRHKHYMNDELISDWVNDKFYRRVDLGNLHVFNEVYDSLASAKSPVK